MLALEFFSTFFIGGVIYGLIEIMFRSHTHWTMVLTGGLCFALIYLISTRTDWNLFILCLAGALIVTAVEFVVGCIVNLALNWDVWDYSAKRYNIMGQVCPSFTACWFLLCFPGVALANVIKIFF